MFHGEIFFPARKHEELAGGAEGSVRTENTKVRKTFNVSQNHEQNYATAPISPCKAASRSQNIRRCWASGSVSLVVER
jgi:hypothetical protein